MDDKLVIWKQLSTAEKFQETLNDKDKIEKHVRIAHTCFDHLQCKNSASYFFDYYSYLQMNRTLKHVQYQFSGFIISLKYNYSKWS